MAKGDGSIIEKARGVWEVQVPLGRDPITGKYRKKSRTVRGTKADARKVRDQMRRELENGIKVEADKVTLADFCEEFIAAKRAAGRASEATVNQDAARLRFMCTIIGDVPLRKIDARMVESLYTEVRKRRNAEGWGCSNSTLHSYHVLLKAVLRKAVDYDLILRNPCDRVDAPPMGSPDRRSLSLEEAARLLDVIDEAEEEAVADLLAKERRQAEWGVAEDRGYLLGMRDVCYVLALRIGLATGMRLGEVLAIPWGAVDFGRGTVSVTQALDSKSKPKAPKTKAGARTIFVDAVTMEHLARWLELQTELLDTLCIDVDAATPVLCSATGGYLNKGNFERWWGRFRKSHGFPDLTFHELRHTQATLLMANKVDVKTVQARMGHTDASLTLNWYAHAVPENDQKAALLFGKLLRQGPKKANIIPMPKSA